jgi:hypothetical protein
VTRLLAAAGRHASTRGAGGPIVWSSQCSSAQPFLIRHLSTGGDLSRERHLGLGEEAFEGLDDGLRRFLGKIVAGIEGAPGHVTCGFAPD